MPRVRIESGAENVRVDITGGDARHLVKVLRLSTGDEVVAFDGKGGEWSATIASAVPSRVTLALGAARRAVTESPCRILLGQGLGKGEKLDLVVRATTELGVAEIVPVATGRAIATAGGTEKIERWRRIAEEACKQSGRSVVPAVHAPEDLPAFLARAASAALKVVPWEGGGVSLASAVAAAGPVTSAAILIGPEGGLSEREVETAKKAGFVAVTLGARILRTETAGIVAVAAMQLLAGDLG